MSIVFFCQSCGSRFEVGEASAGKQGSCRKCGQRMVIPKPTQLASMVAMQAVPAAALAAVAPATAPVEGSNWIDQVNSNVKFAPLTIQNLRRPNRPAAKPSPLDDATNSALYAVRDESAGEWRGRAVKQVSDIKIGWRKVLGLFQTLSRRINEFAYLLSVPFLMMIFTGAALKNRNLALLGATVVVLLNLGRIISGVFNLAIIPFRDSPVQGVMFCIPPLTLIYLTTHWKKMRLPLRRVAVPLITIGLVFAAFTLVPSLTSDGKGLTTDPKEFKARLLSLKNELKDQIDKAQKLDLKSIEAKGGAEYETLKAQLTEQLNAAKRVHGQTAAPAADAKQSPQPASGQGNSLSNLVDQLKQLHGQINEIQNSP